MIGAQDTMAALSVQAVFVLCIFATCVDSQALKGARGVFTDHGAITSVDSVGPVGWPEGAGKDLNMDHFRIVNSGPCAINEARLHKYASSLSASDNLMAVGGDHGKGISECISENCDAIPRIDFDWMSSPDSPDDATSAADAPGTLMDMSAYGRGDHGIAPTSLYGGGGHGIAPTIVKADVASSDFPDLATAKSFPRCERGDWKPTSPGSVVVSAFNNNVAFAGSGCVELQSMDLEHSMWTYIASLPSSLTLTVPKGRKRVGGTLIPELFGSALALGSGVVVVTGATDVSDDSSGATSASLPVVVVFSLLGSDWVQVDTLECVADKGCDCAADARGSCFGSAVAISGKRVAVGNPQNASVLVYEQAKGVPLAWDLVAVLTSPYSHATSPSMFGASVALSPSLLVVGSPAPGQGSRAIIVSMVSGTGFGSAIYDTLEHCCRLGLPCCVSGLVGSATAVTEYEGECAVIVGDPRSSQVHIAKCNTTAVREGGGSAAGACIPSVTVQGAATPGQSIQAIGADGFGGSLAYGGQMILMGHPDRHCSAVGPMQACGTVCEVPLCAPGYCLLYEISLDQEFCQLCSDKARCKGGMRTCSASDAGALGAMALSTVLFFLLFCCLYTLSAFSRGSGPIALLCELFCCLPMMGTGRERLLSEDGGERGGEEGESDSDVEHEGYIPPQVKAALAGISVGPSNDEVSQQGGKEDEAEAGESSDAVEGQQQQQRVVPAGGDVAGEEGQAGPQEGQQERQQEGQEGIIADATTTGGEGKGEGGEGAGGEGAGPAKTSAPKRLTADYGEEDDETSVGVSLNYFQCKICFERPIQTVLVPCGHQALCRKCARKMKTCPICRKVVSKIQQVFHI